MHAHATLPRPAAVTVPPPLAVFQCLHCGTLPSGAPHRVDCFPGFQVALMAVYPALQDALSVDEAGAIERIFRFWTGIAHALRRFQNLADRCVERRWEETSDYVERLLARHVRRTAAHMAPDAAAAS